ncbi:MAG: hypothetical protein J6M27_08135, partial [Lachnospiraceae bacterium]|nr:hypothetical protein [Lachnospiraceae bacterium]
MRILDPREKYLIGFVGLCEEIYTRRMMMIHFIWSKGIRLKKYLALGGAMIVCAGLSACGMGEGGSARIPDEDTVKTQEVSQENDKITDTEKRIVDDAT